MRARLALSLIALAVALLSLALFGVPDFAQDYAAAWGWWHGHDPNGRTDLLLAACCGSLSQRYPPMQTAHPPLATLLALPFALLPWSAARIAWTLGCWAALFAGWQLGRTPYSLCLATLPYWILAFVLGTHEALLLALLAGAAVLLPRFPQRAGALVGFCAALKLYPGLLLVGLWVAGQRRAALAGLGAAVAALVVCELVLGIGVTRSWLAYVPVNTQHYIDQLGNLSLLRLVRLGWPTAPPLPLAALLALLLLLPLWPRLRQGFWLAPLLPIMLLASPLSWRQYSGLVALGEPGRLEVLLLGGCGLLIMLSGFELVPLPESGLLLQLPLLLTLLLMWYRQFKLARASVIQLETHETRPEQS